MHPNGASFPAQIAKAYAASLSFLLRKHKSSYTNPTNDNINRTNINDKTVIK